MNAVGLVAPGQPSTAAHGDMKQSSGSQKRGAGARGRSSAQVLHQLRAQVQDAEDVAARQPVRDGDVRVRRVKCSEDRVVARLPLVSAEPLRHGAREGRVRDEGRDALGAGLEEHLPALVERSAGAREVVHNQDVVTLARLLALSDLDDPLVPLADLAAGHDGEAVRFEGLREALVGAVVGEGDDGDLPGDLVRLLGLDCAQQQGYRGVQRRNSVGVEVEPILQRVQVVDHHADRPSARRQAGQHAADGVGSGNLALAEFALLGAVRVVRQNDGQGRDEGLAEGDQRVELRHHVVVAVEVRQEEHVAVRDLVLRLKAAEIDVVHP
mmetsp:Transcript_174/g.451  ORF Transcript_174/g.451 Transcript_174/m.451 type:complete len:325 (-) Transcript_174:1489-2463(-)